MGAGRKDYYLFGKISKIPLRRDSPPGIIIRSMDCPSGSWWTVLKGRSTRKRRETGIHGTVVARGQT